MANINYPVGLIYEEIFDTDSEQGDVDLGDEHGADCTQLQQMKPIGSQIIPSNKSVPAAPLPQVQDIGGSHHEHRQVLQHTIDHSSSVYNITSINNITTNVNGSAVYSDSDESRVADGSSQHGTSSPTADKDGLKTKERLVSLHVFKTICLWPVKIIISKSFPLAKRALVLSFVVALVCFLVLEVVNYTTTAVFAGLQGLSVAMPVITYLGGWSQETEQKKEGLFRNVAPTTEEQRRQLAQGYRPLDAAEVGTLFRWDQDYVRHLRRAKKLASGTDLMTVELINAAAVVETAEQEARALVAQQYQRLVTEHRQAEGLRKRLLLEPEAAAASLDQRQTRQATEARRIQWRRVEAARDLALWRGCSSNWRRRACWLARVMVRQEEAQEDVSKLALEPIRLDIHKLLEFWLVSLRTLLNEAHKSRQQWLPEYSKMMGKDLVEAISGPPCATAAKAARERRQGFPHVLHRSQASMNAVVELEVLAENVCLLQEPVKEHAQQHKLALENFITWLDATSSQVDLLLSELRMMPGLFIDLDKPEGGGGDGLSFHNWMDDLPRGTLLSISEMEDIRNFILDILVQKSKHDRDTFGPRMKLPK